MGLPFYTPEPAPQAVFKGVPFPQNDASPLSCIFFHWITPILKVGYSRPLGEDDLWAIPDDLGSKVNCEKLEAQWLKRLPPSLHASPGQQSNVPIETKGTAPDLQPPSQSFGEGEGKSTSFLSLFSWRQNKHLKSGRWVKENGKVYDMSFMKALYLTNFWPFMMVCTTQIIAALLIVTSPLITHQILDQIVKAHDYHKDLSTGQAIDGHNPAKSVGFGIGLSIILFAMLFTGMQGTAMRAATTDLISRKSMRLSGKARLTMTNGRINSILTSDVVSAETTFTQAFEFPAGIIQIIVGCALLLYQLGYSALVGIALLLIAAPFQAFMFNLLLKIRFRQWAIQDERIKLLTEVINNIRPVKAYAYEDLFADRVMQYRQKELGQMRKYAFVRSTCNSSMLFVPVITAILTFVTYKLTGHTLDPPSIFSALQLFGILNKPISNLPTDLANFLTGLVQFRRMGDFLKADELKEKINIDEDCPAGVHMTGDFQYDSAAPPDATSGSARVGVPDKQLKREEEEKQKQSEGLSPFSLRNINVMMPRGALVCIVGRVGTGKTSLLMAMINEMRQLHGDVTFGGTVSYVPQQAWVQSGTIRNNITFGNPDDENLDRVNKIIDACALRPDVNMWTDADLTRIGERGITLSGGQRQRVCIARAAYEDTAVVLLDDPLSAVDAHVGHHLMENCLLSGPFAHRTRVLVTHQLDILPYADMILVMDRNEENEGHIVQQGSYEALLAQEGIFQTLMAEFGSQATSGTTSSSNVAEGGAENEMGKERPDKNGPVEEQDNRKQTAAAGGGAGHITIAEERYEGTVSWKTLTRYIQSIDSWWYLILCSSLFILVQANSVATSLFLGSWSASTIHGFTQGQYMGVYAGLGGLYAVLTFARIYYAMAAGRRAGFSMFNQAFYSVMRSPIVWHDQTPTGRIISRLTKDISLLDDKFAQYWHILFSQAITVIGTSGLILYTYPWLGLAFIPLSLAFYLCSTYYRATSREAKRVDSNLRSHVYSSFAEQLNGLPVIRAFNQQEEFQRRIQEVTDSQNRANIMNYALQRWLGIRLELCANLLIMLIGIFGSVFRESVDAARFGVVFTYALTTAGTITYLINTLAVCEREMNNVERVQYYMDLETEAELEKPTDPPDEAWPTDGEVKYENVQLRYRPDLPLVLKGLSFTIKPGEKIGIVGRTGAGKSSIAQSLFRSVELAGGKISVDGVDLADLGLKTLRTRLAIIPQDAFLFAGTVRDNIDPCGLQDDAKLNDALNLIQQSSNTSHSLRDKFKLDSQVMADGINFSAGEKQLLALMRALVKNSKVLLLDEATSSVDPETDALIQKIIQTQFSHTTLISIAHRLQTVAFYDRILVMDAGEIAEFDTPLNLYDDPHSIFRAMCNTKSLSRYDLLKIQAEAASALAAAKAYDSLTAV